MVTAEEQIAVAITDPTRPRIPAGGCRVVSQLTPTSRPFYGVPMPVKQAREVARRLQAKGYHWVILVESPKQINYRR